MTSPPVPIADLFPLMVPPRHGRLPALREAHALLVALPQRVSGVAPIGIRTEPLASENGVFEADAVHLGVRVADARRFPRVTLLHEVGHALDFCVFGAEVTWASQPARPVPGETGPQREAWQAWQAAVQATDVHARLLSARQGTLPSVARVVDYLLQPRELFARAFAQFVIGSEAPEEVAREVRDLTLRELPQQWPEADFVKLRTATGDLLGTYGGEA